MLFNIFFHVMAWHTLGMLCAVSFCGVMLVKRIFFKGSMNFSLAFKALETMGILMYSGRHGFWHDRGLKL